MKRTSFGRKKEVTKDSEYVIELTFRCYDHQEVVIGYHIMENGTYPYGNRICVLELENE